MARRRSNRRSSRPTRPWKPAISAAAANIYGQIIKQDSGNPDALGGLAKCYIERGDLDRAKQTLAMVPPEHAQHATVASAEAALSLSEEVGEVGDVAELRRQVEADPADHAARFDSRWR